MLLTWFSIMIQNDLRRELNLLANCMRKKSLDRTHFSMQSDTVLPIYPHQHTRARNHIHTHTCSHNFRKGLYFHNLAKHTSSWFSNFFQPLFPLCQLVVLCLPYKHPKRFASLAFFSLRFTPFCWIVSNSMTSSRTISMLTPNLYLQTCMNFPHKH